MYGGPKGRAMRQYLSDSIYAKINNIHVMIDNNYATVDNSYATMSMRRLPIMTRQKLKIYIYIKKSYATISMTMQRWTLLYLLNHEQWSRKTTDEVSIYKHVASGDGGLVLGEGCYLEVKDALHYRLGSGDRVSLDRLVLSMIVEQGSGVKVFL